MVTRQPGCRVTIFTTENDQIGHRPAYDEIVKRARDRGLAGASVVRGIEGFGMSSRLHTARLLSLAEDLPVLIILVDVCERLDAFLEELDAALAGLLMVREEIDILRPGQPGPG